MSLRAARFDDDWRRALARDYSVRLEALQFSGIRCLKDDSIFFSKGITAIVGGNGVGKSTLAQATVDVLSGAEGVRAFRDQGDRLAGSELRAAVASPAGVREIRLSIDGGGGRIAPDPVLEGERDPR